jgi:glycosyltransferase involved in cell wall biosynthesis
VTKRRLFYFTASFPFGVGQQWKANELAELAREFADITVVPFSYQGNFDKPKSLPSGIKQLKPLFENEHVEITSPRRALLAIIGHPCRLKFLREFFTRKVYTRFSRFVCWLSASLNAIRLLGHPVIKDIIANGEGAILYFYWGRGSCEFLPFVDTNRFAKVVVRMHGYDLFEFEQGNDGYIPYRAALLDKISVAAPTSIVGVRHLRQLYPKARSDVRLLRCGTINSNSARSEASEDATLRVVSCSYLRAEKRVHLMIEALRFVDFPILWRHVGGAVILGGGVLAEELRSLVRRKGLEEKFHFEGYLDSVMTFLTTNRFDLFVNTSDSEGVPFSIMEAMSAGIPVMATDVGGSREIVHPGAGVLLPSSLTPQQLGRALTEFYNLSDARKHQMRDQAYKDYCEKCDTRVLSRELSATLKS